MPASNYLRAKVVDGALRGITYTAPSNVFISLHTTDPTAGGTPATEVVGGWYARQGATFAAQTAPGQTSISNTITYSPVTSGPVTITHFAVWDASTLGNMLFYAPLGASKTFATTDVPSWLPGQVAVGAT